MIGPLTVDDFADIRPFLEPNVTAWDNNGWGIRAGNGRRETLVWASPYLLRSPSTGAYSLRDACTWQTMIVDIKRPKSIDAEMADNDFESMGWFGGDIQPSSNLKIKSRGKKEIVWSIGSSYITCSPPDWKIRTATAQTKVDVDIHTPYPSRKIDGSMDVGAGRHWHTVIANANLTLASNDRQSSMDGYACHERHTHADKSFNPSNIQRGEGIWWFTAGHPSFKLFLLMRPSMEIANGWLITKDGSEEIHGMDKIVVKHMRQWRDPKNLLFVPSAWELSIKTDSGLLTAKIWAQARAYYLWGYLKSAYNLLYWWLASGCVRYTDKRSGKLQEFVTRNFVHSNRVFVERTL
ncbi:MAG: hypothetical protein ACYCPW_09185 [Nitrososphaerales archaeon]